MSSHPLVPLGEVVLRPRTWNPANAAPDQRFQYLDLASIDHRTKRLMYPREVECLSAPTRARQLVAEGDVLISTVRPNLNAVAVVPPELDSATASTGFCVLRPIEKRLDSRYLFHWVRTPTFIAQMVRQATGASYPAVSDRIILTSTLPVPGLTEQRRIAKLLDLASDMCAMRRVGVDRLVLLKQATLLDRFGDPIENVRGLPVTDLIDIVDPERPVTYGILKPGPDVADGIQYVRLVDMKEDGIDVSAVRRTSSVISNAYRRSILAAGDLLISIRGQVGRVATVPVALAGANITQDTARLAIRGASSVYIRELLRSASVQSWMDRRTKGVAVQGLNLGDLKTLPIPLPDLEAQRLYSRDVLHVDQVEALQREALAKSEALFASLQFRAFEEAA